MNNLLASSGMSGEDGKQQSDINENE